MKKIIYLLIFLLLMYSVNALLIENFKAEVDGKRDRSVSSDGGIIDDVKPGSKIAVEFKIENNNSYEIEEVDVEGIIYDIDDGDDLEDDEFVGDIDPGDDEKAELKFDIPLEIEEDDFLMEIEIEWRDENKSWHKDYLNFTVRVEKERHEIRILRSDLSFSVLECSRATDLEVKVINLGRKDEEDVKIKVINHELGINLEEGEIELEKGVDDDNSYTANFDLFLENAKAGDYILDVSVLYDDGDEADSEEVYLTVVDCKAEQGEEDVEDNDEYEEEEEEIVVKISDKKTTIEEAKKEGDRSIAVLGVMFVFMLLMVVLVIWVMIKRL